MTARRQDGATAFAKASAARTLALAIATKDDAVVVLQERARFAVGQMDELLAALAEFEQRAGLVGVRPGQRAATKEIAGLQIATLTVWGSCAIWAASWAVNPVRQPIWHAPASSASGRTLVVIESPYARQFLHAIMVRLHEANELRFDRLRHYVMDAGDKELAAFLQTGSQPYRIQANNMASTVKSIAQSCVQSLAHASDEPDFSVREWVRGGQGFIFITPRDRDRAALVTLVNAFMNLAIAEALSAPTGKRFRPIAVVVDELASFDFDDLEGVLEKGRKFGVVAFAGRGSLLNKRGSSLAGPASGQIRSPCASGATTHTRCTRFYHANAVARVWLGQSCVPLQAGC